MKNMINSKYSMRWPNGKAKALTLSYDDGVDSDIEFIELMKKYKIKGTFNINSELFAPEGSKNSNNQVFFRMPLSEVKQLYNNEYCEVASHTTVHAYLDQLPTDIAAYSVLQDRKNLEDMFNYQIKGFAYPYGTYNQQVINILKMCGISYARTTKSTFNFSVPENWLELNPTCRHIDPELLTLAEKFVNTPTNQINQPYLFYLWGHTYEFRQDNNWDVIENFFKTVSKKSDIWYATNIEIYNYTNAFNQLQFNLNFNRVFNPTSTDVWFLINQNEQPIKVPAGCEVEF